MKIFIEEFIRPNSFLQFQVGDILDLSTYVQGLDYNAINAQAFYFFSTPIDVEVTLKDGTINSFDILLRNQSNSLFLGKSETSNMELSTCDLDSAISYLQSRDAIFTVGEMDTAKCITLVYHADLDINLFFDVENSPQLSLIHICK